MTVDSRVQVGATICLVPTGNEARGWDGVPISTEIEKIANKYFYALEAQQIRETLRNRFSMWNRSVNLTLDQLRRIKAIIDEQEAK